MVVGFVRKLRDIWNAFPLFKPSYLRERLPGKLGQCVVGIFSSFSIRFPTSLLVVVPNRFSVLLGALALEQQKYDRASKWFRKARKLQLTREWGVEYQAQVYVDQGDQLALNSFIESCISENGMSMGFMDAIRSWAFWNLGFFEFFDLTKRIIRQLESQDLIDSKSNLRLLPQHANHLGHLGFLQLYINYYSKVHDKRIIGIWPDNCVNPYYLKKIIESSPIEIRCFPGKPPKLFPDIRQVDSLIFSRVSKNTWRFEPMVASFSGQIFPELNPSPDNFLRIEPEEDERAKPLQRKLGMDLGKWFVCLHVRESTQGFLISGQNRDADILTYREFCEQVQELGGQVIRMGDPSFPKLPHGYPAIDYAHSEHRSDFFDTWLWGRCRWWTGTVNGASMPPLTFGRPRLVTNKWFWDNNGPNYDIWLPQLLIDKTSNRLYSPSATMANAFNRSMSRDHLSSNNLRLRSNSSDELKLSAIEMFEKTKLSLIDPGELSEIPKTEFDRYLSTLMLVPVTSPIMQLSKNFSNKWQAHEVDFH